MIYTLKDNPNHLNGKPENKRPEPEVASKKASRRKFSAKQKLANLAEMYYYLYVVLDIFSRYVVGWMLVTRELQIPVENSASFRSFSG